ncbi:MAG TPA: transposase [Candidatus Aphodousia gallistercoris]|nr:transposase [Candidatus Aphodousia gallistercoris]
MTARTVRIHSREQKQAVLAAFRSGGKPTVVASEMGLVYRIVRQWYRLYLVGDLRWSEQDDEDFALREKALEYFNMGYKQKKISRLLNLSQEKVKYWQQLFKHGQISFFQTGKPRPKAYSKEFREAILAEVRLGKESKRTICYRHGISMGSLRNWEREKSQQSQLIVTDGDRHE